MNTKKFALYTVTISMIIFLSCGLFDQRSNVAVNAKTSACGGFGKLEKRVSQSYSQDRAAYCRAERLIWNYNSNEKQLDLMHTRIGANCAAKLQVTVEMMDNRYVLLEKDTRQDPAARCVCVFDTYCEIPDVQGSSVELVFENKSYNLDLSKSSDTIIIDTVSLFDCMLPE